MANKSEDTSVARGGQVQIDPELREKLMRLADNANAVLGIIRTLAESIPIATFLSQTLPLLLSGASVPDGGLHDLERLAAVIGYKHKGNVRKFVKKHKVPKYTIGQRDFYRGQDLITAARKAADDGEHQPRKRRPKDNPGGGAGPKAPQRPSR